MRIGHGSLGHAMKELEQARGQEEKDRREPDGCPEFPEEEPPEHVGLAMFLAAMVYVIPALLAAAGLMLLAFRLFIR